MVPNETCHMFVPPENSINYMAFPADWSICMSLFLKILVQSFIPSFSSLYQSASGCRKIFLSLWLLVFQRYSLPSQHLSYFFWIFFPKYFFSAISLIFILLSSSAVGSLWEREGWNSEQCCRRVIVSLSRQSSLLLFLGIHETGRNICPLQQRLIHGLFSHKKTQDSGTNLENISKCCTAWFEVRQCSFVNLSWIWPVCSNGKGEQFFWQS